MKMRRSTLSLLALACLGCVSNVSAPEPEPLGPSVSRPRPPVLDSRFAPLKGVLKIPALINLGEGVTSVDASMIGNNSGALVANNGGGFVAQGGGLQAGAPVYGLKQAAPLAIAGVRGARVYLADAAGLNIPLLDITQTGADGSFELPQVPVGFTFVVVAEVPTASGKVARFQTLVRMGESGVNAEVNAATTLVSAAVLDGLTNTELGGFSSSQFEAAIELVSKRLSDKELPDFTEMSSIKASIEQLASEIDELRQGLSNLRQEMAAAKQSPDKLNEVLRQLPRSARSGSVVAPVASPASGSALPSVTPVSSPAVTPTPDLASLVKSWVVTTLAGSTAGDADGAGAAAQFNFPSGVAVDGSGNLYVADSRNERIRKVTPDGVVTTLAGSTAGDADGTGTTAQFNWPSGVAVDGSGNLYVADSLNHRIRKVTPDGVVTTLAGSAMGGADGTGTAAQFNFPSGVAVDGSGNVYVADSRNERIRKITPEGVVTTLAGSVRGDEDGTGEAAQFKWPSSVAVDGAGNVYVADSYNERIRKVTSEGVVTTLAGSTSGDADGMGATAQFNWPSGVAVDKEGNVYVADSYNFRIRRVAPDGAVTALAGSTMGAADGAGEAAQFNQPLGIAVDGAGNVYVADSSNHRIRKMSK